MVVQLSLSITTSLNRLCHRASGSESFPSKPGVSHHPTGSSGDARGSNGFRRPTCPHCPENYPTTTVESSFVTIGSAELYCSGLTAMTYYWGGYSIERACRLDRIAYA